MPRDDGCLPEPAPHTQNACANGSAHAVVAGSATPALVGHGWILDASNDPETLKREYHRDHMVAFRQRKKQSLADMKTLHAQLEGQLAAQLALRRAVLLSGYPLHGLTGLDAETDTRAMEEPGQRLARYREIYCSLVDEAELRRAENAALRNELERFVKLKLVLHQEMGLLHVVEDPDPEPSGITTNPHKTSSTGGGHTELRGFFVYFEENEAPFYFEPFTRAECDAAKREGYQKVRALQDGFDRGELGVREVQCFGWLAQRSIERTLLNDGSDGPLVSRVQFTKQVGAPAGAAVETLRGLVSYAYECLSSAQKYSRIQRTKFVSHTLQRLGESQEVSIRNAPDPSGSTKVRYLHLLTRVDDTYTTKNGDECQRSTVLMLALDSPRHKLIRETMNRDDVFWITEGTAFVSFVQIDDSTVEIDYGNVCTCISEEQAQYFMIELGAQLLRWESLVMPPRLLSFDE